MRLVSTRRAAALAIAALLTFAVTGAEAATPCPLFLIKSCVFNNRTHLIFTKATNQCLAAKAGLTVIYVGACKFGPG